jgi:hypothetical protein
MQNGGATCSVSNDVLSTVLLSLMLPNNIYFEEKQHLRQHVNSGMTKIHFQFTFSVMRGHFYNTIVNQGTRVCNSQQMCQFFLQVFEIVLGLCIACGEGRCHPVSFRD